MAFSSVSLSDSSVASAWPSRSWWWVVAGAIVLPCVYVPTLATRFEFIDDGGQVYPEPPMPLTERLAVGW